MTVILVLATLITLLSLDWWQSRHIEIRTAGVPQPFRAADRNLRSNQIAGFHLPEQLRYHPGHTWALRESSEFARVGLDDFAARLIGKADKIELPKFGQWVRQGQKLCTVEKDGAKAEMLSPIEGVVTDVNLALAENPSLAVKDPYGDGWLLGVQAPDLKTSFRNLLAGTLARQWMEEAVSRLRGRMPVLAGAVAQDGGVAVSDLSEAIPSERWEELAREFFLN